jgi:hypothetical protein
MVDRNKQADTLTQHDAPEPAGERRRMGKVVHDHKGTATVQWHDAPSDYERVPLEIEGAREGPQAPRRTVQTGELALEREDNHNPYTMSAPADRKRDSGTRTDLRKLSAWIKLMRQLEESKRNSGDDGNED